MKSLVFNIGCADIVEVEKQINDKLSTIEDFVSLKITSNGQNHIAVVLYDGESEVTNAKVKIVEFSINDMAEAQKAIDAALEDLDVVSVEPTVVIDMNRLVIVYDGGEEDTTGGDGDDTTEEDEGTR